MTERHLTITEYLEQTELQRKAHTSRQEMLRSWLKPRIKRVSGGWNCEARGVVGSGFSPAAAYGSWLTSVRKMEVHISYQEDPFWRMKPTLTLKQRGTT